MTSVTGNPMHFQTLQRSFAAHLRAPDTCAAPAGIEDRRMAIYRDLIYNNIESFIAAGFPVLHSVYSEGSSAEGKLQWQAMVRDFVHYHASSSPYFLHISEEFLRYLQYERELRADDPPFLLELAHYEWVELALDVNEAEFPQELVQNGDVLAQVPVVSPLAWSLSYRYPVHRIGPAYQPQEPPPEPTFLLVYRDRSDRVRFMEINAVTARLLQLLQEGERNGGQVLEILAAEIGQVDQKSILVFGRELLEKLLRIGAIAGLKP